MKSICTKFQGNEIRIQSAVLLVVWLYHICVMTEPHTTKEKKKLALLNERATILPLGKTVLAVTPSEANKDW